MKLSRNAIAASALLLALGIVPNADAATDTCPAGYKSPVVRVRCTAENGLTEQQHPKDKYPSGSVNNAAPGTDCNAIPTPTDVNWKYCMRTVQFTYEWVYAGGQLTKLTSVERTVNTPTYGTETEGLVKGNWGDTITPGTRLTPNTYKQIVVDLCLEPVTYSSTLEVKYDNGSGQDCTNSATYDYEITANYGASQGYTQFKPQSAEDEDGTPQLEGKDLEAEEEGLKMGDTSPAGTAKVGMGGAAALAVATVASFFM